MFEQQQHARRASWMGLENKYSPIEFLQAFKNFQQNLADLIEKANKEIKDMHQNMFLIDHPTKAADFDELIENNLQMVIHDEQVYAKIKYADKEKRRIQDIKQHAASLNADLKGRAKEVQLRNESQITRATMGKTMAVFAGNKVDLLVRKFAQILLRKVREKRDKQQ